jgi:hypothetical protein
VVVVASNPGTAHWRDIEEFTRWARHERYGPPAPPPTAPLFRNTYLNTGCNYPPLGAIASAGALHALGAAKEALGWDALSLANAFRAYLSLVEVATLVLTFALFRTLGVRHAPLATIGLYLLPSSWAGGALWGQIDVVTQSFLLFAAIALVAVIVDDEIRPRRDLLLVSAGAAALVGAVMVKQLAVFSVPGLAALLLIAIVAIFHRHGARWFMWAGAIALAVGGGVFGLLDRAVFALPPGYGSAVAYVWDTGTWHSGYLFANGPNVWTFIADRNKTPSDVPVYGSLTPRQAGFAAAGVVCALLVAIFAIHAAIALRDRRRFALDRRLLAATAVVLIGLLNLVVPLLSTGTHERYFFHAFPFLIVGLAGWHAAAPQSAPRARLPWAIAAAFVSGCFVLSILSPGAFGPLFPLRSQAFTAVVLLVSALVLCLGFCDGLLRVIAGRGAPAHETAARR